MFDLGSVPQWLTAFIAGGALVTGALSIKSQREIARKRAATDFFTKTEMDRETLESHKRYSKAIDKLRAVVQAGKMPASFENSDEYWAIRDYLNLHELMAVAILKDVFDDHVCHDFWAGELKRAHVDALPLIRYVQSQPTMEGTYIELIKVAERWADKRRRGLY